ncbi:hypothetical protein FA95DRAFT_1378769 [Auriscalpium vulgare]|uniref:Uncharacterized protein n=1 Tax=Auriscalpium vulgare TaxID=40419 RepID=A0ACB8S8L8_9AGAM|nr:hypothetical protein FA95DRAFT_1378769 [Auriscalpium vulgare]
MTLLSRALYLLFALGALAPATASEPPSSSTSTLGRPCSASQNHLDPSTRKFVSECDALTTCSAPTNGTCIARSCRRDEFAFGYRNATAPPPDMCAAGSFCPDEGDACKPLVAAGNACQFNRDDQCAPPPDWEALADYHNFNGSVCLRSLCTYANATEAQPCTFELTTYADVGPDGGFTNTIVRDSCQTAHLFCNTKTNVCEAVRQVGAPCDYHRDCRSYNCVQNYCESPPEAPFAVAIWQYVVTGFAIVLAMASTCVMLTLMHKRQRLRSYQETRDYCYEQITLRRSILALQKRHAVGKEGSLAESWSDT